MTRFAETPSSFESEGLRLEGALHEDSADLVAVVLHPHPLYGGDMDNHVVTALCRALADLGATTLRFNFRGAGGSEGAFDGGKGEARDALAAVAHLRRSRPTARIVFAGYSFGAGVAAAATADAAATDAFHVDALVLVSPPVGMLPAEGLAAPPPTLVITGERDDIAPPAKLQPLAGSGVELVIVAGVDHFWFPGLDDLASSVRSFVAAQVPAAP